MKVEISRMYGKQWMHNLGLTMASMAITAMVCCQVGIQRAAADEPEQKPVYDTEETALAAEFLAAGARTAIVLGDRSFWSRVRAQRAAVETVIGGTYSPGDFVLEINQPLHEPGLVSGTTRDSSAFELWAPYVRSLPPAHFEALTRGRQTELVNRELRVSLVVGIIRQQGQNGTPFLCLAFSAKTADLSATRSRIIVLEELEDDTELRGWLGQVWADWLNPPDPPTPEPEPDPCDPEQRALLWDCVVCASCAGAAGISCAILCAIDNDWGQNDPNFLNCWSACMQDVPGASPIYDIACYTACLVCAGRAAVKPAPKIKPVPWEVMQF